jgi:hypothetical protein
VAVTIETAAAVTTITAAEGTAKTTVMMETVAAVYWRGHWFVSSVSEVRIMLNITTQTLEYTKDKYNAKIRK